MKRILIATVLVVVSGCAGQEDKSPPQMEDDASVCDIQLKRTCVIPGDTKCLAYATEDLSNCQEGN